MRALVSDGGGMRGAFTAGVLASLRDNGINYEYFDNYVGTSAGAGAMTYFLTDQVEAGIRIWQDHIPREFIKWHGIKPQSNIKYLEKIFREIEPLSCKTLSARKQKAFISLTNLDTQKTEYICLNDSGDPVKILLAGIDLPFLAEPSIINGKVYYDGGITSAIPLRYAESLGSDEIWVILTTPRGYRRKNMRWKVASMLARKNPSLHKLFAERPKNENPILEEIEKRKDLVVIRPEKKLPLHWLKQDKDAIKSAFELGRQAAKKVLRGKGLIK